MEYARSFLWACNRVLNSPATLAEFFGNNCWNGTFSPGTSRWCIGFPAAFWSVFSKTKAIQKNFPGCGLGSQKRSRQGTGTQWMSLREPGTRPALSGDWQQIRAVMWENGIATSMRFFEIYTASLTKSYGPQNWWPLDIELFLSVFNSDTLSKYCIKFKDFCPRCLFGCFTL